MFSACGVVMCPCETVMYIKWLQNKIADYMDGAEHGDQLCVSILSKFKEWVYAPEPHLIASFFDLFENIEQQIPKSTKDFGPESTSLIHIYARRILVGFTSMMFEQLCDLVTEFQMYTGGIVIGDQGNMNGHLPKRMVYKNASKIEETLEKEIVDVQSGIRAKQATLKTLEEQCEDLQRSSVSGLSKSVLHAKTTVALGKKNETEVIHSVYEFSDAPEASSTRRVLVKEEESDETHRRTIIEASLNVAMVQARLGHTKEAMQMINEHMRVSQQSSNSGFLVYSLAALCYILSRAVPGSLELQTRPIPGTTPAERHYLEMEELLKRLYERSEVENLPEISLFAKLLLAETAILHPKKQRDSSLGTFDHTHQTKEDDSKSTKYSAPGFPRLQKPCVASTESLDACLYAKRLAFELALLSSTVPLKDKSGLFLPPKASGREAFTESDSRRKLEAMQSCQTADQIRAAGWQLWGSTRLSLSAALRILHSSHKSNASEIASLSLILVNIYDHFGAEPIDRLSLNGKLMSLLQENMSLQRSWDIINQRRAVNTRQSRLAIKLAARVHIHPKINDVMHIQNKVERRELTALAYLSGGYYEDADRAALAGYTLARNTCMSTYALRLLLLRGRIHVESGSWETAVPYICSVLEQYRQMNADVLGAEASMYMAQIWSCMGLEYIERALEEMKECMYIILAHGSLETKGIARQTLAFLLIQEAGGFSSLDSPRITRILRLLRDAESDFSKIRDWKQKAYVLHLASIIYDKLKDTQSRDDCARACLQLRQMMHASPSDIFTKTYINI